jgi:hypothetical protein
MRDLCLLATLVAATPAAAQTVREFSVARQQQGEPAMLVQVDFAAGTLALRPAPAGTLYGFRLTYDEARFAPLAEYGRDGSLRLGAAALGQGGVRVASSRTATQAATIALSRQADLDLEFRLDAVEATLELGGLRLGRLHFGASASRSVLRFGEPNPVRCAAATLDAGAGELTVTGLGNARCERLDVRGGAGRVTLDFSGQWRGVMAVAAEMKMGELVLRLPRRAGVRLTTDNFLARFAPTGLTSADEGHTWTTAGFADAASRLEVRIESAIGGVRVDWID